MAIIKDISQLKPVMDSVKAVTTINNQINPAPTNISEDGFSKFERIITGINQLAENFLKLKQINQGSNGQATHQLTNSTIGSMSADVHFARDKQANSAKGNDNKMQIVLRQLINALENHINQCAVENPNMSLGECIQKIPVNVTQLKVMMQLAKSQNKR